MGRGHGPLSAEKLLDVRLSAICSRNRYTHDPAVVVAELRATAGDRTDILAQVAGLFAGYYDDAPTHALCVALREIEGAGAWVGLGQRRRGLTPHSTDGFQR